LLLVIGALAAVGIVLGNKIRHLEDAAFNSPITTTGPSPGNTTNNNSSSNTSLPATNNAGAASSPAPATIPVPGWKYLGCYYDAELRILAGRRGTSNNMTNEFCGAWCVTQTGDDSALRHMGTQGGRECYCGSASDEALRTKMAPDWQCARQCFGRDGQAENCGGNWALSLWERDLGR
jgi:hypothetical protein